jgi:hypothetical protein
MWHYNFCRNTPNTFYPAYLTLVDVILLQRLGVFDIILILIYSLYHFFLTLVPPYMWVMDETICEDEGLNSRSKDAMTCVIFEDVMVFFICLVFVVAFLH